jgi:hypothetical protein
LLSFGLNEIRPQIVLADQLLNLLAQKYNYSSACYYCEEDPILTGNLENRIRQLEKYIRDFDEFHSRKFEYAFQVQKNSVIRSKLVTRTELLKRQLKRSRR